MKLLLLSGFGINIKVDSGKLHIKDGFKDPGVKGVEYIYKPKFIDIDNIIIYGYNFPLHIISLKNTKF
ncbi:MAG: hypothetical protein SCH70_14805 [Candidatus Methanoperedens sp.]|nr:hypothetical protein [Candidatus Methanoperedens sp.]